MDKDILIKLATPASIFALALSILTAPLVSNADLGGKGSSSNPIYVTSKYGSW